MQTAKILTAPSINTDTFNVQVVSALPNGHFLSPRISVLILDYSATILSVEYIDPLQAYPVEDGIEVVWATATEFNCEKFEVERSNSSLVFENIQTVKGNGNSNTYHLYKIKDTRPYNGANYYRIKEIDYDGHYQYSKIINAHFEHFKVNVYPNPLTR
ncbi:MAG: hypothetical protein IPN33_05590 [Saprospiraceae bacterium]|nr:hypothetical protein [Saprospiraceae bacterium]